MTRNAALAAIRSLGCTARVEDGEFRVCPRGGSEAQAYYTDDAQDAVDTAAAMVRAMRARLGLRLVTVDGVEVAC